MKVLRTLAVAFSQYSRIPMPQFKWSDEDMRCSMSAFPLVGAVIGLIFVAVCRLALSSDMPDTAAAFLMTAVPVIITGGFHIDGFMDVSDAVSSYRSREEKLEILKDPHIGAFSVIRLAIVGLIYLASLIIILDSENAAAIIYVLASGFVLSRALSALSVLTFRSAKNEGMLYYEATAARTGRTVNLIFTVIWIILVSVSMVLADHLAGAIGVCAAALSFAWYRHMSYKQFGGITGDTAGYFVVVCETAVAAGGAAAALAMF